jgi:hypothetical protein
LELHWVFPYECPELSDLEREQELSGVDPFGERMVGDGRVFDASDKKGAAAEVRPTDIDS